MESPEISVIIPVYNAEKTIAWTIDSILNQTFKNFELIIINDGSTDSTLDIIKKFKDKRIKVFNQKNQGAPRARNLGMKKSKGQYISFIDADDMWTNDKLELQLKALKNSKAEVAYSFVDLIDTNNKKICSLDRQIINGNVQKKIFIKNFIDCGSNVLIKKKNLKHKFDENLKGGQEWDLLINISKKSNFICVPKVQILYRLTPKSISSQVKRQEKQCLRIIKKSITKYKDLKKFKRKSLKNIYHYLLNKANSQQDKTSLRIHLLAKLIFYDPGTIINLRLIKETLLRK